jgi:hypothetical protein
MDRRLSQHGENPQRPIKRKHQVSLMSCTVLERKLISSRGVLAWLIGIVVSV